jgi:segregation and condensation protein A
MASELLYYKSRSLLPTGEIEDEFFMPPLPPELIQKLLEYKKFQKASISLLENFEFRSDSFTRNPVSSEIAGNEEYFEISLFDLLKAFADVMESHRVIEQAEIIFDEILVSDRIDYIISLLKEKEAVLFAETFSGKPKKAEIIATFLAMLEMAKTKMVRIMQHRLFGDIRIFRNFSMENVS